MLVVNSVLKFPYIILSLNIKFTISSEIFHTVEEKRLVTEYFVSSWNDTP